MGAMISRRNAIAGSVGFLGASVLRAKQGNELRGQCGLVTASLTSHFSERASKGKLTLLEFPRFLQDELGLKIIDFNTMSFHTLEKSYLEKLKGAIDDTGCIATNLKMNQRVDMASRDLAVRAHALEIYKKTIDAAAFLGLRWARPLPRSEIPDRSLYIDAYRELIDYAGERGVGLLVENFGWMMDDPDSIVDLVQAIGPDRVFVGLDTGNWSSNEVRYPALEKSFPLAVTCDFKAKAFSNGFEHPAYDLKRCFDIGIEAGYKGPWIFEHGHQDLATAVKEIRWLHDHVRSWITG